MADGVRFDISIEAATLGVDTASDQINAFAEKVQFVNRVATSFDKVVAAARLRLDEAATASKAAAAALATAESKYKELESAANKAAKEVEKAALAGKDTKQLQAAADAAAAKMKAQAAAVDELKKKSDAAAATQTKLAASLKTLEGQQSAAAAQIKQGISKELAGSKVAAEKLGTSTAASGSKVTAAMGAVKAGTALAAAAFVALAAAAVAGVGAMGAFAIKSNPAAVMRLTMAMQRLQLGLKNLFTGVKVDKFVAALEDIMSLFDAGTSSANGLKVLVETLLQPLFDAGAKAGPFIKEMFKGMIYGALQVVIAVLSLRNAIFKMLPPETRAAIKKWIDDNVTLQNAFKVGTAIVLILTAAVVALGVAAIAAAWPFIKIAAIVAAAIALFVYWDQVIAWLEETWDSLVEYIKGVPDAWMKAAGAMIDGLVEGIKKGASKVWDAMKGLATGAVGAFKEKLGIASPSKVMMLQAEYTAQGYVEGIEGSAPQVQSALESMVSPADVGASSSPAVAGATAQAAPASGASRSIVIQQLTIGDSPVAQDNLAKAKAMLLEILEGATLSIGGGEAPAT